MRALGNETLTIIRPTIDTDTVDNSINYTYDPPESSTDVRGCNVQPFLISEKLQEEFDIDRDFKRTTWRVWCPVTDTTLGVMPYDRVEWRGQIYEVFGFKGVWNHLGGATRHIQFIIQLREG